MREKKVDQTSKLILEPDGTVILNGEKIERCLRINIANISLLGPIKVELFCKKGHKKVKITAQVASLSISYSGLHFRV